MDRDELVASDNAIGFGRAGGGHATVLGCQVWAQNMAPLIKEVIKEKNIH